MGNYKVFGVELSPYSVKVRSYLRYKQIPHEWVTRGMAQMPEFGKYAKLPLVPLLVTPDNEGWQDSTPIIEKLEQRYPENPILPDNEALAFLATLIEEFGDEWANKPMFHYRWHREIDQQSAGERIARDQMGPDADPSTINATTQMVIQRMVPRLALVGSSPDTAETIETDFRNLVSILEHHLANRPYLFGGRPSLADFGLWAQVYECYTDPTPGALLKQDAPATCAWVERMLSPTMEGEYETWDTLEETLLPLLKEQVGAMFLPWTHANAKALAKGEERFTIALKSGDFTQEPQRYHAKSLKVLMEKYAQLQDKETVNQILDRAGCLAWFQK